MAELNRQDIWPDDLLTAPLQYAANVEAAVKASEKLMQTAKASYEAISGSGSVGKAAKETEQLTQAQLELEKVNKQISIAQAKNNQEYLAQQEILADLKKEIRDKAALGEKEAKTVNAQNASIKELNAALRANRDAYDKLATAEQRNSEEGKKLLATIQEQDKELKSMRKEMGQNQLFVGEYENAMKGLKLELKAARDEMAGIAKTLGADSPEFIAAAEKAGKLKDEINDINDAVKNTEASPFENLGNTFTDAGKKLLSLDFGGAANSARQFATASKAITFKEAIGGVKDLGKTFTTLGKAILTNPLFLIAAVVIGIVVAIVQLKDKIPFLSKAFDAVGAAIDWVIQMLKDFGDWLGLTTFAADEKRERIIKNAEKEAEALEKRYDREIRLAQAAGKETIELERKKQIAILVTSNKAIQALKDQFKQNGKFTEEQQEQWNEWTEKAGSALFELEVLKVQQAQSDKKRSDELAAQRRKQIDDLETIKIKEEELQRQKDFAYQLELQQLAQRIAYRTTSEEELYSILIGLEEEKTEKFMSYQDLLDKRRDESNEKQKKQFEEQLQRTQILVNGLSTLFSDAINDSEATVKSVSKKLFIFLLDNLEREMLAIQAASIAKATAEAFATPDSVLTFGATGITRSLILAGLIKAGFAVAKAQISRFAVGTDNAPGGLAWVGEQGTELIQTPSGQTWLSPNKATLANLPKGSKVFTNDETMMMMAGISNFSSMKGDFVLYSKLGSLEQTIKNSDAKIVDAIERSNNKILTQGNLVYEIKKKHDGSKQMIRSKSLN